MNKIVSALMIFLILACASDEQLHFVTLEHHHGNPIVHINLPRAEGKVKVVPVINNALREELITLLTFDDSLEVTTIEQAIASFQKGYEQIHQLYPDELPGWEAEVNGEITYEDRKWVGIKLTSYIYTGGAHGYGAVRYLNFDKEKGIELDAWELFQDTTHFQIYAESRFRQQENIPENGSINSTGFMFEDGNFYLPENIGLSPQGITLYYNPYEVSSFADGPIELMLPFQEVEKFLKKRVKS